MELTRKITKSNKRDLFKDKEFYNKLFKIALPITIQNFIGSFVNMLDTVMIGRVGESEIAAVGIANQYFFIFCLLVMGIASGCSIFISQCWGTKDIKNIRRVLGLGTITGSIISILFMATSLIFPTQIISIFNKDPHVIELGSQYLRIVSISYFFTALTFNYASSLRSIHNATIPMMVSIIALATNAFFNYILIFGKLGFPELGVAGAAIATVIARIVESILLLSYVYIKKNVLAAKLRELIDITREFSIKVFKTVIPVTLNELCWSLGVMVYTIAYGRIGTQAIASVQICNTVQNLYMVIVFGMANASTVMIGNKIGAGMEDEGKIYARRFLVLGSIAGVLLGLLLAVSARGVISFFNVSDTVLHDSLMILYISSVVMVIRVVNIILIVGILRAGGDAKYSLMAEACTMWFIGVPLSFIGAFVFKLPVYYVYALITIEEIVKAVVGIARFKSDKWINNVVHDMQ